MPIHKSIQFFELKRAINSCLENSLLPDQFLIVINGNLDNQKKSYLYYLKKKFKFIEIFYCKKIGIHNALNYGVDKSKYNIIIRADSDDVNFKNRFKKQLHFFIKNKLDILGAVNIEVYNKNSCYIKKINEKPKLINFLIRNPLNHMTVVFNKKKIKKLGLYPSINLKEDYALWFKAYINNLKIQNMVEPLVYTYIDSNFYNRRKNFISFFSEIKLTMFIFKLNYFIGTIMTFITFLRCFILILPNKFLKNLYKIILRKKINK